jgi:glycerol uptake facilitator protein
MFPELLAEFIGMFVLILIGDGAVAVATLAGSGAPGIAGLAAGWGLAIAIATWLTGLTSGAHLNPAVSVSMAVYRDFPWRKVGPYCLAQILAAFLASAVVYWNYQPSFQSTDPGLERSAAVFSTFPAGLLDQTLGTALFLMMFLAVTDSTRDLVRMSLMIGVSVVAIGMAFGGSHGYAMNPAADFGPRLFTVIAGFRNNGLTENPRVFWIPIVAPILGGIIGSAAYDYGIRRFLPDAK